MKKPNISIGFHRPSVSLLAFLLMVCLSATTAISQTRVTGTVVDTNSDPLYGVSVIVKGSPDGIATDADGNYSIQANKDDVLLFRYIGMTPVEIKVGSQTVINVTMQEEAGSLDEVVVIGYGTQKRGAITGAVSTVSGTELIKAPTMSMSNVVGSRVAGIASRQSSGQPGSDNAALTLRGQSGIVYVIDGIRRTESDFNGLDPQEIESVSVLKDASAVAIYGLDANGVIIVTTHKGKQGKTDITYTGTVGWSQNAETQTWLDGPGYAYWYNKANVLNGGQEIFTKEMVDCMVAGTNGWGNTDWYDEVYGTGFRTSHNVTASGGSDKYKFFVSLGYLKEDGNIDRYDYERFNIRTNIDADIANGLKLTAGIAGRMENRDAPNFSANPDDFANVPMQVVRAVPYVPTTMDYNGKEYYVAPRNNSAYFSPLYSIYDSGYQKYNYYYFSSNISLQWDVPFVKGLSLKFTGAYDASFLFSKALTTPQMLMVNNPFPSGIQQTADGPTLTYQLLKPTTGMDTKLNRSSSRPYTTTTQTSINYANSFGSHNVSALLLAETRQNGSDVFAAYGTGLQFLSLDELNMVTNLGYEGNTIHPSISGTSSVAKSAGFAGRASYNYDDKYFAEVTYRYDGSYLFGGMNSRWVGLPGVSLGWRIDREPFFKADWVQNLKIRAGYGKTATSGINPFLWKNTMVIANNGVVIGGTPQSYIYVGTLGNPNLTWAKCDNYNIGVDALLFNGLLGIEADVFYKYEYDKLASISGEYPPSMGGYYFSTANVNKADYKGFDITLTHNNKIDKFYYGVKLIWSYAYGRWLKYSQDNDNDPEYARLTGKQIGAKRGFIATGLYQTQEQIDNAPIPTHCTGTPELGDIMYADRNGDGQITYAGDMGYVGKSSTPTHTGSLNMFGSWNGFDFDLLWAWGLGHDVALTGVYTASTSEGIMDHTAFTRPFYHGGNSPLYLVENSWTPDNTNAEFPRLSITPATNNNAYSSTFWYRNGNYLRLKTAQIGYTFPQRWVSHAGITRLRIYVEGYNLLTFSGLSKYNIDPESPAVNNGYYPQQRKYSIGLNISF